MICGKIKKSETPDGCLDVESFYPPHNRKKMSVNDRNTDSSVYLCVTHDTSLPSIFTPFSAERMDSR